MAHAHVQAPGGTGPVQPATSTRMRRVLVGLVLVIVVAHVAALTALWPRGPLPVPPRSVSPYAGVQFATGTVERVDRSTCTGSSVDRLPDGTIPSSTTCASWVVDLQTGPEAGSTVTVGVTPQLDRAGVTTGTAVRLARYPAQDSDPTQAPVYAFADFDRRTPLTVLLIGFVALVVVVARLRGLGALLGLGAAFAMIVAFILPALRHQENPLLVAAVGAGAVMTVVLFASHGISAKTATALLGTLAGIWLTAALAAWATAAAHLNGLGTEENLALSRLTTGADLTPVILAGFVLAGLGILNDVTITQSSAVWELRRNAPQLTRRPLFVSAMRIGRDHLSSTVYTIAFAYAGLALPTLLLQDIYDAPVAQLITGNQIGEEIARTLVASIGLILSIPLTTALAVLVAAPPTARTRHR